MPGRRSDSAPPRMTLPCGGNVTGRTKAPRILLPDPSKPGRTMPTNRKQAVPNPGRDLGAYPSWMSCGRICIALGMREVREKRRQWREHLKHPAEFFSRHVFPTVLGPKKRHFISSITPPSAPRHDGGKHQEGYMVSVALDLSGLGDYSFWVSSTTAPGATPTTSTASARISPPILKSLAKMDDDPYRSSAGEPQGVGGFAGESTIARRIPRADFLRNRITPADPGPISPTSRGDDLRAG